MISVKKEEINYPALLLLTMLMIIFYVIATNEKEASKSSYDNTHEVIEQVEMEYYGEFIPILEI